MRIVYISGVWDLFHVGHLNVIKRASQLGESLIVGVVTDDLASTYKEAPIIPYAQRRAIIESLWYVEKVAEVGCLGFLPPGIDIRAYGPEHGKYPAQVSAMEKWAEMGIQGICIPRTPNVSTTLIKERILNEQTNKDCCSITDVNTRCLCKE